MRQDWITVWTDRLASLRRKPSELRREGNRLRDQGLWSAAAAAYVRYLARRPTDRSVRIQLGHMLKEAGDAQAAKRAYAEAAAMGEPDADLFRMRGHLALRTDDPSGAADLFLASWRADPEQGGAADLFSQDCLPHALAAIERAGLSPPAGYVEMSGGRLVVGWAASPDAAGPAEVEFLQDGHVLGKVCANLPRPEVEQAGLARLNSGFVIDIDSLERAPRPDLPIKARLNGDGRSLMGAPFRAGPPDALQRWILRAMPPPARPVEPPRLSFVMPIHNPEPSWLVEALSSVCAQDRGDWELVCVDDGSTDEIRNLLSVWRQSDSRIKVLRNERALGVSAATNMGLGAARGGILAFMDHDDRIEPETTRRLIEAADAGAEIVYSDEVLTHANAESVRHLEARGAFSHDYYLSHPYFVHLIAMSRDLALDVGGLDEGLTISADVDFALRALERAQTIAHVPAILYRWRTHQGSLGHKKKPHVTQATIGAIERHLQRIGKTAKVTSGPVFNTYDVQWPVSKGRSIAIIPTRDRVDLLSRSISTVLSTTDDSLDIVVVDHESREQATQSYLDNLPSRVKVMRHEGPFNFSAINNRAVLNNAHDYDRLLFLNNDVEALNSNWFDRLCGLVDRPDVGVAGASLLYPDMRVQHVGVVLGLGGPAEHVFKFAPSRLAGGLANPGPGCAFAVVRDVSAVTAACMMMRRSVFEEVGGFDETLEVGFNDTDLCLRVRKAGYKILNDAGCWLIHHESATRKKTDQLTHPEDAARFTERWSAALQAGDPWYSPLLSLDPSKPDAFLLEDEFAPRLSRISLVGERDA